MRVCAHHIRFRQFVLAEWQIGCIDPPLLAGARSLHLDRRANAAVCSEADAARMDSKGKKQEKIMPIRTCARLDATKGGELRHPIGV
jgi:hypothetical protein